jgi:hypothetical protein
MKLIQLRRTNGHYNEGRAYQPTTKGHFYDPKTADENGNLTWFKAGVGSKAFGLQPNQWVAKIGKKWFVRISGPKPTPGTFYHRAGKTGSARGQSRITKTTWSTQVIPATPKQSRLFAKAEIIAPPISPWTNYPLPLGEKRRWNEIMEEHARIKAQYK